MPAWDSVRHNASMGQKYAMPAWDKASMMPVWSKVRHNASMGQSATQCDKVRHIPARELDKVTHIAGMGQKLIQCQRRAKQHTVPVLYKMKQSLSHWNDFPTTGIHTL